MTEMQTIDRLIARKAHSYLARPGDETTHIYLLIDGWAARYRLLSDGRRQITALYVPGDFCDLAWRRTPTAPQHVITLTPVRAVRIETATLERLVECDPLARHIIRKKAHLESERLCEWLISLGRRNGLERLGHLFCELVERAGQMSKGCGSCEMPLTQVDLADITGLTPVHVNRTLQQMRRSGLIDLSAKKLRVHDLPALRKIAFFKSKGAETDNAQDAPDALNLFDILPADLRQPPPKGVSAGGRAKRSPHLSRRKGNVARTVPNRGTGIATR
ncbi:MAG: Crp/Fnr family transcriptional regulator [Sphingomonas sp.]|nr:Crp/Fnr family transcriptional regulator [Sphingomonas sp.]